jgi:hypothetical protein
MAFFGVDAYVSVFAVDKISPIPALEFFFSLNSRHEIILFFIVATFMQITAKYQANSK